MSHFSIPKNSKTALRTAAIQRRNQLPMAEISRCVQEKIKAWPLFQEAKMILAYCAIRNELNLLPLASCFPGKQWYLPKVNSQAPWNTESRMAFYRYIPGTRLVPGSYNVPEPDSQELLVQCQASNPLLILVPGLLFDRQGHRLGYGKGYYDRFLNGLKMEGVDYISVGACPDSLLVEHLPSEPHDIPVQAILTESMQFFVPKSNMHP